MNPNESHSDDEHLRSLFQTAYPPLPDDGFTSRVVTRLRPQPALTFSGSAWAAIGGFLGAAISAAAIGFGSDAAAKVGAIAPEFVETIRLLLRPELGIATGAVVLGLGFTWIVMRAASGQTRSRRV